LAEPFRQPESLSDEEAPMDANSGEPWSEMDISDLENELDHGRTIAKTAGFFCRDVTEVRAKMKEFGLVTRPSSRTHIPTG
jgi:hypothetical protein